jgi:hypothetical protein
MIEFFLGSATIKDATKAWREFPGRAVPTNAGCLAAINRTEELPPLSNPCPKWEGAVIDALNITLLDKSLCQASKHLSSLPA